MNINLPLKKALVYSLSFSLVFMQTTYGIDFANHPSVFSSEVQTNNAGIQYINIAAANDQGLSHNKFDEYNVEESGLILNNTIGVDEDDRLILDEYASVLGGTVTANENLKSSADIILNEVLAENGQASQLLGTTEVLGGNADVIIANPNGIECDGCGFINTNKITLTTGSSGFDQQNNLHFDINEGQVTIKGQGANITDQEVFNILSRNVLLKGNISNTKEDNNGNSTTNNDVEVNIIAGTNKYDYNTGQYTKVDSETQNDNAYAIDSTALGGIYAGKVKLIATEDGIGVKMAGNVATGSGDFVITADGKIQLTSDSVSSAKGIKIQANKGYDVEIGDATSESQATLIAYDGKIAVDASGKIKADNVTLSASQAATAEGNIIDPTVISGIDLNAQQDIDFTNIILDTTQSAKITTSAGNITARSNDIYNARGIINADDIAFTAQTGNIVLIDYVATAQKDINLNAQGDIILDNTIETGAIEAGSRYNTKDGNIQINANNINNDAYLFAEQGSINLDADNLITNNKVIKATSAQLSANDITNNNMIETQDKLELLAEDGSVVNQEGASISVQNDNKNGQLEIVANSAVLKGEAYTDYGVINAADLMLSGYLDAYDLELDIDNNLTIADNNPFSANDLISVIAQGDEMDFSDYFNLAVSNNLNILNNSGMLDINVNNGSIYLGEDSIATINTAQATLNNGVIYSSGNTDITADQLSVTNDGVLSNNGSDLTLTIADDINVTQGGSIQASDNATISANNINVSGVGTQTQQVENAETGATETKSITSSIITGSGDSSINVNTLTNEGVIYGDGILLIQDNDGNDNTNNTVINLTNEGSIGANTLNIKGNAITLNDQARISSQNDMNIYLESLSLNGPDAIIGGSTSGIATTNIYTNALNNEGTVSSKGNLIINDNGENLTVTNAKEGVITGGSVSITADQLQLKDDSVLGSTGNLSVVINNLIQDTTAYILGTSSGVGATTLTLLQSGLNNDSIIRSQGELVVNVGDNDITNNVNSALIGVGGLTLNAKAVDNSGTLSALEGDLTINANDSVTNRSDGYTASLGLIQARNININTNNLTNYSAIDAVDNITVDAQNIYNGLDITVESSEIREDQQRDYGFSSLR